MNRYNLLIRTAALGALCLLTLRAGAANPSSIHWHTDYIRAREATSREKRPLLLFFTMDGCGYCHLMSQRTFANVRVVEDVSSLFVPVAVDGPRQKWLAQKLGVRVYPTTVLISPDDRVLDVIGGYVDSDHLRRRLAVAAREYRTAARPVTR